MATKHLTKCTQKYVSLLNCSVSKKVLGDCCKKFYQTEKKYVTEKTRSSKPLALVGATVGAVGTVGGAYYYQSSDVDRRKLRVSVGGVGRFLRSLRIGLLISLDYHWSLMGVDEDSTEYEQVISEVHQRAADRILIGCLQNGGLYIKLGQGLVSLNHILPKEYTKTLQKLQDKCLIRKKDEVLQLFLEDFGKPHTDVFDSFESEPIAAASLAQVYRAVTKDGKEVAVKVQYIDLQDRFVGDVSTVNVLLKIAALLHPKFNFQWILNELRGTLEQELDFVNEGRNSERCARELSHFKFVHVPIVYWDLTTKRVLTTEFIYGTKINQVSTLKEAGYSLADIDRKLFQAFAEQIFHSGFVHADPHPGNILIRRSKIDHKAELVLLDHGLYECLPSDKRQSLCNLWKSIVLHDYQGMEVYSNQLGVKDSFLFAEILMQRPLKLHKYQLKLTLSETDMKYMTIMAKQRFDKIMAALRQMPNHMLLVIRNINTIRAIAKDHGDPVDRYTVMARSATQGAFDYAGAGLAAKFAGIRQRFLFEFRIWTDAIKTWIVQLFIRMAVYFGRIPDLKMLGVST